MADSKMDQFQVPLTEHLMAGLVHGTRPLWKLLGKIESDSIREAIEEKNIDRPIYVAGLARAGSTVLLEMIAGHQDVTSHQYRDFLTIFTPHWCDQAFRRFSKGVCAPVERSHGDRVMVTPESPEAMEEIIWMTFFSDLHNPSRSNVLGRTTQNAEFCQFYRDHIRKLLLTRNASRYASKGNYNTTRLEYLAELFPDARFVIPVRDPVDHIASLQKQHRLLLQAAEQHRRSIAYLNRVGHFEFGANRIPVNAGNQETTRSILNDWNHVDEIRGWAKYWSSIYGYVADLLERDLDIARRTLVVRYEDLCERSESTLAQLFEHCQLPDSNSIIESYSEKLAKPDYYAPSFSDAEHQTIDDETSRVARLFGYEPAAVVC